jgi:hypothetical protein
VRRRGPWTGVASVAAVAAIGAMGMLALGGCSDDSGEEVIGSGASPTTAAVAIDPDAPTAPSPTDGGDGFAPVLRTVAVPCPAELGFLTSRSGESCYQLSETGGLGTDVIESATVELAGGYWEIQLTMTDVGIARFNELASACIDQTTTCPTGRIAVVAARAVVSTTTITKATYERDEVMVTGRFDADEARAVADALNP